MNRKQRRWKTYLEVAAEKIAIVIGITMLILAFGFSGISMVAEGIMRSNAKEVAQYIVQEYGQETAQNGYWYLVNDKDHNGYCPGNEGTIYAKLLNIDGVKMSLALGSGSIFNTTIYPIPTNLNPAGTHWEIWDGEQWLIPQKA